MTSKDTILTTDTITENSREESRRTAELCAPSERAVGGDLRLRYLAKIGSKKKSLKLGLRKPARSELGGKDIPGAKNKGKAAGSFDSVLKRLVQIQALERQAVNVFNHRLIS